MVPMPQTDVRVRIAGDVESLGIGKLLRIAIGRADHREHDFAGRDRLAVQFDVASRQPEHPLQRRAVAQHLFDRRWQ